MDVVSHAIAGAATGLYWGRPGLGAAVAALPDLVLGIRRRASPSLAYNLTHTLAFSLLAGAVVQVLYPPLGWLVFWCLVSHLALDVPTHGKEWAPTLLWPFSYRRYSLGTEWEFFNTSWSNGLDLTIIWSILWLVAALL